MISIRSHKSLIITAILVLQASNGYADEDPFKSRVPPPLVGRWNLTLQGADGNYPSWLEVRQSGYRTLVGSFVGQFGSARPISRVDFADGRLHFSIPPQWEHRTDEIVFEGKYDADVIRGQTTDEMGRRVSWEAQRAPALKRPAPQKWGTPIDLFNRKDLSGWKPRTATQKHGWIVKDNVLVNATPGNDLLSESKYDDFQLHAEFRYPKGSNSGIYLRGRYELQIEDSIGQEPDSHNLGGLYGFLTPSTNAGKNAGEWQSVDITLVGRELTVVLNDQRIIDRQSIPGTTGGALDSNEANPGPILLQGDHGVVEFRRLTITPAE